MDGIIQKSYISGLLIKNNDTWKNHIDSSLEPVVYWVEPESHTSKLALEFALYIS